MESLAISIILVNHTFIVSIYVHCRFKIWIGPNAHLDSAHSFYDDQKCLYHQDIDEVVRHLGQLLREDSRTLASYGLRDGCVVHCHISSTPYSTQGPSTSQTVSRGAHLRHRDSSRAHTATVPNTGPETNEFRYPRWAVALLLYTYRFPLIGLPLDAIVRFVFDQQAQAAAQPGFIRRTYRRLLSTIYRENRTDEASPLDRAADAAARVPSQRLCLGDYILWIFAGQFVAVWGFVYAFPQLCDHTALGLLVLLTLYFFFVVCRSRDQLGETRPTDEQIGISTSPDR
ncbi:hypothetical protein NECAME_08896 [Necator americanus]|uniref:Ubiquitin-like domain-containing protein n=1 Tax=Necator americanus TaxID=51031 RepID=W2TGW3_NECAM|nr:hypothetical protein NECAME_08896 [Necator americanus]ETN80819.1 hypothetical protein NECAME_08896 [Necator americanus]